MRYLRCAYTQIGDSRFVWDKQARNVVIYIVFTFHTPGIYLKFNDVHENSSKFHTWWVWGWMNKYYRAEKQPDCTSGVTAENKAPSLGWAWPGWMCLYRMLWRILCVIVAEACMYIVNRAGSSLISRCSASLFCCCIYLYLYPYLYPRFWKDAALFEEKTRFIVMALAVTQFVFFSFSVCL